MKNINHLIDIAGQSHQHLPAFVSLLVGLLIMKKKSYFFGDNENLGDNFPVTFMELERR